MSNRKIKARGNKTLDLTLGKRYRPLGRNIFEGGGEFGLPVVSNGLGSITTMNSSQASAAGFTPTKIGLVNVSSSGGSGGAGDMSGGGSGGGGSNVMGAISGVLGGLSGVVKGFTSNSQIADTSGIRSGIEETENTNYGAASDFQGLSGMYTDTDWQDTDYEMKDVRGVSAGQMIGNTLSSVASGAMAGLSMGGGPWTAIAGAAIGLGTGIGGIFAGNKKARKEAAELNRLAEMANRRAENNYGNTYNNLKAEEMQRSLLNVAAKGGYLRKYDGDSDILGGNVKTVSDPSQVIFPEDRFGNPTFYTNPRGFQYLTTPSGVSRGVSLGASGSSFLDSWNRRRAATGRYMPQLGNGLLEQQKKNRDSTISFYRPVKAIWLNSMGVNAAGFYNPESRAVEFSSQYNSIPTLRTHEYSHASLATPQEKKIGEILSGTSYNDRYLDNPGEVYARLNEMRESLGLDPAHIYDAKEIGRLRKTAGKKDKDFFSRYDDSTLMKLINDVAVSDQSADYTNYAKDGGRIHIKPSKRGTFTAAAKKRGMGVQEFAGKVLANKGNYSSAMVKKAQFAKNAAGWKHAEGGPEKGNPYPENRIRYRQILESIEDKMSEAYNWAAGNGYSEEADDVMTAAFPLLYDYIPNTVFPSDSSNFDHYSRTGRKYSPIMIPDPESRETREAIDAVNSLAPEDFQKFIDMGVKGQYMKMLMDSKVRKALPFAKQFLAPVQSWAVPYLDRYMQAADEKYGDKKAMGGNLSTHGADFSNGMVSINSGGLHEENPLEGVPMGVDEQGIPNLVEEGEVIYNDYVFSNRFAPKKRELQGVNLSPRYTNWTFAKIAEDISKESSERPNDPISRRSLDTSLAKLAELQEMKRAEKGKRGTQQLMAYGGRRYDGITDIDSLYSDPFVGSVNQALEEAELNYYASRSPEIQKGLERIRKGSQKSDSLPTWMRYAPVVGSAAGALTNLLRNPDYDNANIISSEADSLSRPAVKFRPLNSYMRFRPVDRNYLLNRIEAQTGATRRAILNASAGNSGAAMAGLLASDRQTQEAIGDAFLKMRQYNDAQRRQVQEFNRATDQYNSQGLMQADLQNAQITQNRDRLRASLMAQAAQMREASDSALEASRSASLTGLFDNLGMIGRENRDTNMLESMKDSELFGVLNEAMRRGWKRNGGMLTRKNRRRR